MLNGIRHVAACAALAALAACAHQAQSTQTAAAPATRVARVQERDFTIVLEENGTVGAPSAENSQLAFPSSGVIERIDVTVGQRVSAGEALASLDLRPFELAAASAHADARAANESAAAASVNRYGARLSVDRAALERAVRLYAAGVVAQKDVQDARAALAGDEADARAAAAGRSAAEAQAVSAQARALSAQADVNRAVLRSPIDGVVTAVLHRPGEAVDPSTDVMTVAPQTQHEITLRVPSSDAAHILAGDRVQLTVTGVADAAIGRVAAVVGSVDPATQTATVIVNGVPAGAEAGAAVRARITVAVRRGLVIPQAAIVQDPQSGNDVVFVEQKQKDGTLAFAERTVTVESEKGTSALVSSGLRAGDRIAAAGAFELLAPAGGD
jgi:RND family efflux transporter MFP subunit